MDNKPDGEKPHLRTITPEDNTILRGDLNEDVGADRYTCYLGVHMSHTRPCRNHNLALIKTCLKKMSTRLATYTWPLRSTTGWFIGIA